MNNQFDLKYALFKLLRPLLFEDGKTLNEIGLIAGINPLVIHRIADGYPVSWRHYFKLLRYLGYELEIKLVPKRRI